MIFDQYHLKNITLDSTNLDKTLGAQIKANLIKKMRRVAPKKRVLRFVTLKPGRFAIGHMKQLTKRLADIIKVKK